MNHIHPDCGTEFLNEMVVSWCTQEGITLTRSRPYHKNDNTYIEQKNGHWVRKELGYRRLDTLKVVSYVNQYYDKLCLFRNHFVAQRKALSSLKVGKKYRKHYDQAKTPYRRVLEHASIPEEVKAHLTEVHHNINLVELKKELGRLKTLLFNINQRYGTDVR